jgi:biopolymer transport protein ExbD
VKPRRVGLPPVREGGVNVTPLIDVVMCLIIFFMLAAKIGVTTGIDRTIAIPASIKGTKIAQDMGNTLTLNVRAGLADQPAVSALVKGQLTELKLHDSATTHNQIADTLKFFRYGKDLAPGGWGPNADNPAFKVIIRGDKEMDYRYLEPVLLACADANVKSVNFSTEIVMENR